LFKKCVIRVTTDDLKCTQGSAVSYADAVTSTAPNASNMLERLAKVSYAYRVSALVSVVQPLSVMSATALLQHIDRTLHK
jgi:hypothetical protein